MLRMELITYSIGGFNYKILAYAYPCPVPSEALKAWYVDHKTPPYVSCEPSIQRHSLAEGDIVVLVSDGAQQVDQLP
jgi:serine/threonine protein phosphatase PrpC